MQMYVDFEGFREKHVHCLGFMYIYINIMTRGKGKKKRTPVLLKGIIASLKLRAKPPEKNGPNCLKKEDGS